MLKPTFALTIGALRSTTASAAAGPQRLTVARAMDVAADAVQIRLLRRAEVALGDAISLSLGHDGDDEAVFSGTVAALRPDLTAVTVIGLGNMQRLLDLRVAAWYDGQSAGDIARDLIEQAGLEAGAVDDGPTLPLYTVDRRQSGYGHLKQLADRLGYELYARRDGKICFHALGDSVGLDGAGLGGGGLAAAASAAAATLLGGGSEGYQFGQHLLGGQAQRQPPAWGRIVVGGESPMSGQGDGTAHWLTVNDADYRGEAGDGAPARLILDPAARTKDIADRFAAGSLATAARRAHQVRIRVLGRPQVDLGDTITVGDAPDGLLNGEGYIRTLQHSFDSEAGFVSDLQIALRAA